MTSGWSPGPPECRDDARPAGTAQAGWALPHPAPKASACSPAARLQLAPSIRRHRLTPLDEQGAIKIRADSEAGINYFRGLIPAMIRKSSPPNWINCLERDKI